MEQYLLVRATVENWGIICPGKWESQTMSVFSDGTYESEIVFCHDPVFSESQNQNEHRVQTGRIKKEQFNQMMTILNEEWIDSDICSDGCDGVAWQIKMFYPSGRTKRSTGKLGYIYGQPIARITKFFPKIIP